MNDIRQSINPKPNVLFWGLLLTGIGTMLLLDRLGIADLRSVNRTWWPIIPIAMGISKLFQPHGRWSAFSLIVVGAWLQITTLRLFGLTFPSSWPLPLIALGTIMVARALIDAVGRRRSAEAAERAETTEGMP